MRTPSKHTPCSGLNLLRFRPVVALVRWRGFPAVFQASLLVVYVALAVLGWGLYTPSGVNTKLYAKTNLVNLLIWGLWWPAIVWVTFWLGRVWCTVCPLELVSSRAEKLGTTLGIAQRALSDTAARGSLVILFFAALQMLVPGIQIHRVPHYTSVFLWCSLVLAVVVGLLYKNRAFCRGVCPVALLLSAYGRGGMIAVRPVSPSAGSANAIACRSLLNPRRLDTSKDCLVCGDCLKADRSGEMQLLLRAPYARADAREPVASWPMTLFVMIVSGFVTYELSGVWKPAGDAFLWVPTQVKAGNAAGWVQGAWTIVVWPLAMWLLLGAVALLAGAGKSLTEVWRRLALPIAPVVAAGHMAKAMEKFSSWAGFLPHAWAEPAGVQTVFKMHTKQMPQPAPWLAPATLSTVCLIVLVVGTIFALREALLTDPAAGRKRWLPILLLAGFYSFLVLGWSGWIK
ncbi:MAG: hypothetical protein N3B01_10505 [Verrucomicrobiae bacterium]|nr:hypothetical protein [Verrucomicrobiae bacterium]